MTVDVRFAELRRLFELACDLAPEQRRQRLAQESDDTELLIEVETLLFAQTRSLQRAQAPVRALLDSLPDTELSVGDRIGAWRLERKLASGGMGAVYLAERADGHFQQQAAIKLMRGMPTPEALAHLASERQFLAGLQHPNIARLLDGGATPAGQPYLVMEYIEGIPIDRYCAGLKLDLVGRLRLFQTVCQAVQFAHQRFIVHCDLKPSNVLVRNDGMPSLLDFGIARALDRAGNTATDPDANYFTPSYASPEQMLGGAVSTSSDVYSLGLILFELLSGRKARLHADDHTVTELRNAVRKPSELASDDACPWRNRLRGDLDAIVLRATAGAPEARYPSAAALAEDIQRYLELQPVLARPQTVTYRYGRLLRRRWPLFAGAAAFVVFAAFFTWRVISERDRALSAEHEARVQAATAEQVSSFLVSVFEFANPEKNSARPDISAREVLDQGAARIETELKNQPAVRARLSDVLARAFWMIGKPDRAIPMYRNAADLWLSPAVNQPLQAAATLSKLAVVTTNSTTDPLPAEAAARQSLAIRQARLPADDPALADAHNTLGLVLGDRAKYAEAKSEYDQALAIRIKNSGPDSLATASTLHNIGTLYRHQGLMEPAEEYFRRALKIKTITYGDKPHPDMLVTLENLGKVLSATGRTDEAIELFTRAIADTTRLEGKDSADVANNYNDLGAALHDAGRFAEATANYRIAMDIDERRIGRENSDYVQPLNNTASAFDDMGDYAAAEPLFRESLRIRRKIMKPEDPYVARAEANLARVLIRQGKYAEAEPLMQHAQTVRTEHFGLAHIETYKSQLMQADLQRRKGDLVGARAALIALADTPAPVTPQVKSLRLRWLGLTESAQHDPANAADHLLQAWQLMAKAWGEKHPLTAEVALDYAQVVLDAGDKAKARETLQSIAAVVEAAFAPVSPQRALLKSLNKRAW